MRYQTFSKKPREYKTNLRTLLEAELFVNISEIHEILKEDCYKDLHSRYLDLLLEILHITSESGRLVMFIKKKFHLKFNNFLVILKILEFNQDL